MFREPQTVKHGCLDVIRELRAEIASLRRQLAEAQAQERERIRETIKAEAEVLDDNGYFGQAETWRRVYRALSPPQSDKGEK